jgi:uncharacterized protein YuzE
MATMIGQSAKTQRLIAQVLELGKRIAELGDKDVWLSYDREADVLYVSFGHRQEATDTVELDDIGVLLRYRGRKLVGITVLDASKR